MPADPTRLPTAGYVPIGRRSSVTIALRTVAMTLLSIVLALLILTLSAKSTAATPAPPPSPVSRAKALIEYTARF